MIQEPIQPTLSPSSPSSSPRSRRNTALRVGLVIALCVAVTVPVVIAMAANSTTPSLSTLAAGATAVPNAQPKSEREGKGNAKGPKGDNGQGKGPKGDKGPGKGPITIKAIKGSDLSLATEDGWTRTITATTDTIITKGGQAITVGALNLGDEIRFHQTRNADGSYRITAIEVPTPKAGGEVTKVDGDNITVKKKDGTTRVITVTGSTAYSVGPNPGTKSDIKVGVEIDAHGSISGDTFTATAVKVKLPHAGGMVTAKTGNSITVKKRDGTTATIHVTDSTKYAVNGKDAATLADIAVGDKVNAEGTLRTDGSLDALAVHGGPPKGEKPEKAPG